MKRALFALILASLPCPGITFTAPGTAKCENSTWVGGNTNTCTLPGAPATGSVVLVYVQTFGGLPASVVDSGGATYTHSPSSPDNRNDSAAGSVDIYYRIATGVETASIVTTLVNTAGCCTVHVNVFGVSGGTAVFDTDAKANTPNVGTVNLPSLTPSTGTGELFFAGCADENDCSAIGTPWTGDGQTGGFGDGAGYILAQTTTQAVNWAGFTGMRWSSVAIAFKASGTVASAPQSLTLLGIQ